MPQLSQLSEVYLSQFLWLAIALASIFFVVARGMVPKIQARSGPSTITPPSVLAMAL